MIDLKEQLGKLLRIMARIQITVPRVCLQPVLVCHYVRSRGLAP